jgi:hypothetical protein
MLSRRKGRAEQQESDHQQGDQPEQGEFAG